ncbi:LysR family substrate-binding domain-containing protein [Microbacterium fluvii]|uniref:LysR family substrate-binding domain-containing protein n=1 Tax=Microbacterium fluvii TaxID=415215 RepID=A0ABW2H7P4_9MICO|nr:LysR family substrate-binding domain-containing protein [Microbacterium fluvii]MCU4671024.1 LysR family substrate-binding domain-containing protein [Microbacterium fluvii]
MVGGGGSRKRRPAAGAKAAASARSASAARRSGAGSPKSATKRAQKPEPQPAPLTGTFVLGVVPGATPGKWIDAWQQRHPEAPLELRPFSVADQLAQLRSGEIDAAIVRLPLDREGLHVIPLYDEVPVAVVSVDSHLTAADELTLDDLAGEIVIVPRDDVLAAVIPGAVAPAFTPPVDTAEAIATVAAGVGVIVVPMSLARLHRRKDVDYRPLRGAPTSRVALAWPAEATTPAVEAFVGIVRGRTANSSRS